MSPEQGRGREARPAQRPLLGRRDPLRDAHAARAVRRRERDRHRAQAHHGGAAGAVAARPGDRSAARRDRAPRAAEVPRGALSERPGHARGAAPRGGEPGRSRRAVAARRRPCRSSMRRPSRCRSPRPSRPSWRAPSRRCRGRRPPSKGRRAAGAGCSSSASWSGALAAGAAGTALMVRRSSHAAHASVATTVRSFRRDARSPDAAAQRRHPSTRGRLPPSRPSAVSHPVATPKAAGPRERARKARGERERSGGRLVGARRPCRRPQRPSAPRRRPKPRPRRARRRHPAPAPEADAGGRPDVRRREGLRRGRDDQRRKREGARRPGGAPRPRALALLQVGAPGTRRPIDGRRHAQPVLRRRRPGPLGHPHGRGVPARSRALRAGRRRPVSAIARARSRAPAGSPK